MSVVLLSGGNYRLCEYEYGEKVAVITYMRVGGRDVINSTVKCP